MTDTNICEQDLYDVLTPTYPGRPIVRLDARAFEYATSFGLTSITVHLATGETDELVLKNLHPDQMLAGARRRRFDCKVSLAEQMADHEINVYRHLLAPRAVGPRLHTAVADHARSRFWLFVEKVRGVELWQVEDPAVWASVAQWAGAFHRSLREHAAEFTPLLPRLDKAWFGGRHTLADHALGASRDTRAPRLGRALAASELDVRMASMPASVVHGELYPSNVMIRSATEISRERVVPIDWETAAIGPPLLDLAALTSGWDTATSRSMTLAYGEVDAQALALCRAHLALRWVAAPGGWSPPEEHRHDWIGEALDALEEAGT